MVPRSSGGQIRIHSAASPLTTGWAMPYSPVVCQRPLSSWIQSTGRGRTTLLCIQSSSLVTPLTSVCRNMMPNSPRCRPKMVTLVPSSSGSPATGAAQLPYAGAWYGWRRWRVSMLSHGSGRPGGGGDAVAAEAEPGAQPGELAGDRAGRRQHIGGLRRGDEATEPLNDMQAQPARGGGQLPGIVLREVRRDGENPGGDDVQQELTGAVCLAGHGDIRRRELPVRRAQIDADNRLAGSRSEVEPADLAWRVRAQLKHALSVHAHEDGRRIRGNGPI